jgi:hypothetical protein
MKLRPGRSEWDMAITEGYEGPNPWRRESPLTRSKRPLPPWRVRLPANDRGRSKSRRRASCSVAADEPTRQGALSC